MACNVPDDEDDADDANDVISDQVPPDGFF